MKLLDKREADSELNLHPIYFNNSEIEGSIYNPEDAEEIALLKKQLKMNPLQAALLARQLELKQAIITIVQTEKCTIYESCLNGGEILC